MASLLLDTHIFIWTANGSPRLCLDIRALVTGPANAVFVSAASVWYHSDKLDRCRQGWPALKSPDRYAHCKEAAAMQISIEEAQVQLPALADRVRSGGEVIITRDGEPCIKLVACEPAAPEGSRKPRRLDLLEGAFKISDEAVDALLAPLTKTEVLALFWDGKTE